MPRPAGWRAAAAVAACDVITWKGSVWRGHSPRYTAIDPGGSVRRSGRYNRAPDRFPSSRSWPALYTALDLATAIGEIRRNVENHRFNHFRYTEIWVQLEAVLDCTDAAALGLRLEDLLDDEDVSVGQDIAEVARAEGIEGLLVPSATLIGVILVIFPDRLRTGSLLQAQRFVDPRLTKQGGPSKP